MKILSIVLLAFAPAIGIADDHDSIKLPDAAAAKRESVAQASVEVSANRETSDATAISAADTEPARQTNFPVPPPKTGSHIAADDNSCIQCHGDTDLWDEKSRQFFILRDKLAKDVHWIKGVNCTDCHGGNYKSQEPREAHALEDGFRSKPDEVKKYCVYCHDAEALELVKGVHSKAGPKNELGSGTLLSCDKCHGAVSHQLLPVKDPGSPVFIDNQVKVCGSCHEKDYESYKKKCARPGTIQNGAAGDRVLCRLPRRTRHL